MVQIGCVAMQDDFAQLISELGGTGKVATSLGVDPSTVSCWIARRSIPIRRWPGLVDLGTSPDRLFSLHTRAATGSQVTDVVS
jgi:hypothetical protein